MLNSGSLAAAFSNAAWTKGNVFKSANGWTQEAAWGLVRLRDWTTPTGTALEDLRTTKGARSPHIVSAETMWFDPAHSGRRPRVRSPGGILTHHRRCHACGRLAWDLLQIPNAVMHMWDKPESHATVAGDPRDRNPRGTLTDNQHA